MCFSLEADLAATVLTPVGGPGRPRGARGTRLLPLAALPLLLAAHQAIEAVVWLGLDGHVDPGVQAAAVRAYLLIAAPLLPMLVPVALILAEDVPARRRAMWPFAAVGWASSHRWLRAFGAVNLVGAVVVFAAHKAAFASLWCFWAALASVLVLAHLRRRR